MAIGAPAGLRVPIFRGTPRKTPERPCTNCGDPMPGNFCRMCGQRKIEVRVSLGRMMMEVLDDQFSINSALPRTLVSLLFRPGHLTREYVSGRIARYIPPFRLYLVASVVFFVALSMLPELRDPLANTGIDSESTITVGSPDVAASEARRRVREEVVPAPPRPAAPSSAAPRGEPPRSEAPAGAAAVLGGKLRAEADDGEETDAAAEQPQPAASSESAADSSAGQPQSSPATVASDSSATASRPAAATAATADSSVQQPQAAAPASGTEPRPDATAGASTDEKAGGAADAQARDMPDPPAAAPVPPQMPPRPSGFLKGVEIKTGNTQLDSVANERLEHFRRMEPRDAARQLISAYLDHVPQVMFLMLPVFAALLKLLYVRSRRFYVEHFVFALHLHAFAFLCYLVMIVTRFPPLTTIVSLWMFVYLFAAMKRVYRQGWFVTATKYVALGATYAVVVTIAAMLTFVATVLTA
ncbi:MAG TPA: DUF3667 domain-containing protein [Longimicrobium sp.]|nr:DUF3667 domain-containing protein [Longimicrobium sp.]